MHLQHLPVRTCSDYKAPKLVSWAFEPGLVCLILSKSWFLFKKSTLAMSAKKFALPRISVVPGSKALNKDLFKVNVTVPAVLVPAKEVSKAIRSLPTLAIPRIKPVQPAAAKDFRLILLFNSEIEEKYEQICHLLTLDFDHWSAEDILESILPVGMSIPCSYEQIGHLVHLNLLPEHEPYKFLIGETFLAKTPSCQTVLNKLGSIHATYRTFDMEVIAGKENNTLVECRESGCVFRFDYAKVYWNSRLQHEHNRLIEQFKFGQVVVDMFAGVGPFAIPAAAHKKCTVYANDLNPDSYHALIANAALNKCTVKAFCMDAREFARKMFFEEKNPVQADHLIMNLPASAHEFLDVFKGTTVQCLIHCYVFVKKFEREEEQREAAIGLIEDVLHLTSVDVHNVHHVRNVAPNKEMMCVSFKIISGKRPKLQTSK